jgi:hypothetical protein
VGLPKELDLGKFVNPNKSMILKARPAMQSTSLDPKLQWCPSVSMGKWQTKRLLDDLEHTN